MRRALALANVFNVLVAIYFIVIAIISLVQLRWYHQLTITTKVRHIITSTTSYFAFIVILVVAVLLIAIFMIGASKLSTKIYISSLRDQSEPAGEPNLTSHHQKPPPIEQQHSRLLTTTTTTTAATTTATTDGASGQPMRGGGLDASHHQPDSSNFCSMLLNLIASIGLIVIIVVWLLNTGEPVRDSISSQLDYAFARYQFSNRSNHYSVAIDAMQDVNDCCGSLDYTDFPHQRISGLSTGHYPGSCCGKNIFGVMARVLCTPEEIVRARQTTGCVVAIANHYDLVSLLIVPVALASLFVCIMVMAMTTLLRGHESNLLLPSSSSSILLHGDQQYHTRHNQALGGPSAQTNLIEARKFASTPDKLELMNTRPTPSTSGSSNAPVAPISGDPAQPQTPTTKMTETA